MLNFGPYIPVHLLILEACFGARAEAIADHNPPDGPAGGQTAFRWSVQKFLNEWEQTRPDDPYCQPG